MTATKNKPQQIVLPLAAYLWTAFIVLSTTGAQLLPKRAVLTVDNGEGRFLQENQDESPAIVDVAVVGGGLSGLYVAWRLLTADKNVSESISPSRNVTVSLYEVSDRVGGRLLSILPPNGVGGNNFRAEFGHMHFPDERSHLMSFVTNYFNIPVTKSHMDEAENLCYLRGEHVRVANISEGAQDIYRLAWLEQNRDPFHLLRTAVETVIPNAQEFNEAEWQEAKRNAQFDGQFLYELSLWNVLSMVMSSEAYKFCVDYFGLDTLLARQNAAEGLYKLSKYYTSKTAYVTLTGGMEEIALALRDAILEAGGSINYDHQLTHFESIGGNKDRKLDESLVWASEWDESPLEAQYGVGSRNEMDAGGAPDTDEAPVRAPYKLGAANETNDSDANSTRRLQGDGGGHGSEASVTTGDANKDTLYKLHFSNGNTVQARRIILAIPKRSLQLLRQDIPFFQDEDVNSLINSVEPVPASKLFLCYSHPWWTKTGVNKGRSIADQSLRQTFYYDKCILASYTDGASQASWSFMEPMGFKTKPLYFGDTVSRWQKFEAPSQIVRNAQQKLRLMHSLRFIPEPVAAGYMNWEREPFGGECHVWKVGVKSWEVQEGIRKPLADWNVHIIGEAYSAHPQVIEGALESAEQLLQKYFFAVEIPGTWESTGRITWQEGTNVEVGQKVSASSDGRRIAVVLKNTPPQARELRSVGLGKKGRVQVYEYVGTEEVGGWDLIGFAIESELFMGGSDYIAALSGDGSRLAIGVVKSDAQGTGLGYFQVFEYQHHSNWTKLGEVIENIKINVFFGSSLAFDESGNILAIGAPQYKNGSGRVHLFRYNDEAWRPIGEIHGTDGDALGSSVCLSSLGTIVAAGAPLAEDAVGYVVIYRLNDDVWQQQNAHLKGKNAGERFGFDIAMSGNGDRIAVGAPGVGAGRAAAYFDDGKNWASYAVVEGDEVGDRAGFSVDLSSDGSALVVGMPRSESADGDFGSGYARVFAISTDSAPEQIGSDLIGDGTGDKMGYAVFASADGKHIVIGNPSTNNAGGGQVSVFSLVPELDHGAAEKKPVQNHTADPILDEETDPTPDQETNKDIDVIGTNHSSAYLNILDTVATNDNLSFLSRYLQQSKEDLPQITGTEFFTLFAPTNLAFKIFSISQDAKEYDLARNGHRRRILLHLISPGYWTSENFPHGVPLDTLLEGYPLVLGTNPPSVNNYEVATPDILASNGVIHKIDSMLLPESWGHDEPGRMATILETISSPQGNFYEWMIKLESAGLLDYTSGDLLAFLDGEGPLTVFAPINEAFWSGQYSNILVDPQLLAQVALYHIIPGLEVVNTEFSSREGSFPTLQGSNAQFTVRGETTRVNDIEIVLPNIRVKNGVLHGITGVLIPPNLDIHTPDPTVAWNVRNILDTVAADDDLSILSSYLQRSQVDIPELTGKGHFTLLAPTNHAFNAYLNSQNSDHYNFEKSGQRRKFLLQLICRGYYKTERFSHGFQLDTLHKEAYVILGTNPPTVNNYELVTPDILASNGVIHKINSVMFPRIMGGRGPSPSILETLGQREFSFYHFMKAIEAAGLLEDIDGDGPLAILNKQKDMTVFAPTDEALENISTGQNSNVLVDPRLLAQVVLYHFIPGQKVKIYEYSTGTYSLPTFEGSAMNFTVYGDNARVNDVDIVLPNVEVVPGEEGASDGIIHGIDAILLPPDLAP